MLRDILHGFFNIIDPGWQNRAMEETLEVMEMYRDEFTTY